MRSIQWQQELYHPYRQGNGVYVHVYTNGYDYMLHYIHVLYMYMVFNVDGA